MSELKSITATKSFTYNPESYEEIHDGPERATQAEFENYVYECAVEDFGGEGFTLTKKTEEGERVIPNCKIYMVWVSPTLDESEEIHPDWYQDNGTPMDSEGQDMEYLETRIIV